MFEKLHYFVLYIKTYFKCLIEKKSTLVRVYIYTYIFCFTYEIYTYIMLMF